MPKVKEISVTFSTDNLGVNERDVVEHLNNYPDIKCNHDWFDNQFIVSAKGVEIDYIHSAVDEAVAHVNGLKRKNEATPLHTSVRFLINAPIESIENFVAETSSEVEGIDAFNVGYKVVVSSGIFDDQHLTEYVGKYFDIV